MITLLLAVLIEMRPDSKVGVYAPGNHDIERTADVMAYSVSKLFDGSREQREEVEGGFCFPVVRAEARRGEVFRVRRYMSAEYLNRIYRRAWAGKRVFLGNVGRSSVHRTWAIHVMLRTQYELFGEGSFDVTVLQRSCIPR